MGAGFTRGPLDAHLQGRWQTSGPGVGGQSFLCATVQSVAAAQTNLIVAGWVITQPMRVYSISEYYRDIVGGAISFNVLKNSTFSVTGATGLFVGGATTRGPSSLLSAMITKSSDDAVGTGVRLSSARDLSPGDRLFIAITTDGGETITDATWVLCVGIRGHANVNEGDD